MTTEELTKAANSITEAWKQISEAIQEFANSLFKVFGTITKTKNQSYKAPNKYLSSKRRHPRKNDKHTFYKVERKIQRHLPYQRRIF